MKKYIFSLCLLIIFFFMLSYPEEVRLGAISGLSLWYNSLVPLLFPFLILSSLLLSGGSLSLLLNPFLPFLKKYGWFNPWIIFPVFFGLFCGFPMGAKTICDLIREEKLTTKEGNRLLPLVSQASPMFITGYVGTFILKQKLPVLKIFTYLYLPPLLFFLLGLFFSKRKNQPSYISTSHQRRKNEQKNSMSLQKEHTIWNSFTIIVTIGIYMMLFSIAVRLCTILLPKNNLVSLLLCTLEFSTGIHTLNLASFLSEELRTGLILALTSFGGFCTAFQTASLVKEHHLTMKYYLFMKLFLAAFVFLFYWIDII